MTRINNAAVFHIKEFTLTDSNNKTAKFPYWHSVNLSDVCCAFVTHSFSTSSGGFIYDIDI